MELKAKEVLKTMREICNGYNCPFCPMGNDNHECCACVEDDTLFDVNKIIEVCTKWREEHPYKTYADVFFEKFPNASRCSHNT